MILPSLGYGYFFDLATCDKGVRTPPQLAQQLLILLIQVLGVHVPGQGTLFGHVVNENDDKIVRLGVDQGLTNSLL